MNDLTNAKFIAGYKYHPDHEEIYWLCNHPESLDLIFSKDKNKAFIFDDELTALTEINDILAAENRPWFTPVAELLQDETPIMKTSQQNKQISLLEAEKKIKEYLKLFNERSNSNLDLFLTINRQDNSIRGYGKSVKIGDAVANFCAVLAIKGLKVQCVDQYTFIVKL